LFEEYKQHGRVSLRRFLIRRGLKIYPGFYVLLVLYGAFDIVLTPKCGPGVLSSVLHEAIFVQNYTTALFNHTWSLAVEEHFYLAIGCAIAFLALRQALGVVPFLCAAILPICLALRLIAYVPHREVTLYPTHLRIDALAWGVIISYVFHFRPAIIAAVVRHRGLVGGICALSVLPVFLTDLDESWYVQTYGLSVNYLAFGGLVAIAASAPAAARPGWLLTRVAPLGAYSYSAYLWHMFAKRALSLVRRRGVINWPYPVELALFALLTFAIGVLMAKLVEFPILRIRDRYWPSAKVPAGGAGKAPAAECSGRTV
jgi:peptidoglycan/LPS O-acetylase OafA/YrhL